MLQRPKVQDRRSPRYLQILRFLQLKTGLKTTLVPPSLPGSRPHQPDAPQALTPYRDPLESLTRIPRALLSSHDSHRLQAIRIPTGKPPRLTHQPSARGQSPFLTAAKGASRRCARAAAAWSVANRRTVLPPRPVPPLSVYTFRGWVGGDCPERRQPISERSR